MNNTIIKKLIASPNIDDLRIGIELIRDKELSEIVDIFEYQGLQDKIPKYSTYMGYTMEKNGYQHLFIQAGSITLSGNTCFLFCVESPLKSCFYENI